MLRMCVLGCGRIGRMHGDNIAAHPRTELSGVFDVHAPSAEAVATKHKVENYSTPEDVFSDSGVDAILIATPTPTHVDFIEMGVRARKAILCEKPIDLSLDRVNDLKGRIDGTDVPIMLGEEVVAVSAQGSRLVNPSLMARCDDYDTVVVTLVTASGRQAVITNSREAAYGYDQRVELFGSEGKLMSENRRETLVTKDIAGATIVSAPLQHFFMERYAEAFDAEIEQFADAVENGTPVPVGFEEGRIALLLADACSRSVAEERTIRTSEIG